MIYIGPWCTLPNLDYNVKVEDVSFSMLGIELSPYRNCNDINIKQKK